MRVRIEMGTSWDILTEASSNSLTLTAARHFRSPILISDTFGSVSAQVNAAN